MGIGPVPAMRKLFARTGLSLADFDLFELNEAFAPQVLAVLRDEPIPAEKLNVNGGAIALGHPIGCTGTRIVVTLVHEMLRRKARRGLATLCVSGGMGMAIAVEAVKSRFHCSTRFYWVLQVLRFYEVLRVLRGSTAASSPRFARRAYRKPHTGSVRQRENFRTR